MTLLSGNVEIASHLDSVADRAAFRNWFAFLAEAQFFTPAAQRAAEIIDCSSLVRYAYREALNRHDSRWAAGANLPLIAAIPSVTKYSYPRTPTGPRLFRTANDTYSEFADAKTLYRFNVFFIGRDIALARRGDLLLFRQRAQRSSFHTMIVIGRSQFTSNPSPLVVYDTGPEGTQDGVIKRLSFDELLRFPEPRWRPIAQNGAFLGVFGWNILKD